jgi:hypothetical protein
LIGSLAATHDDIYLLIVNITKPLTKSKRNINIFISISLIMNNLRSLIKKHLLVEKRIGQIMSNITITYAFDIDRKKHAEDRSTRNDIEDYNEKEISNAEILYAIDLTKRKIAEKINSGEIQDGVSFVIKSAEKELAVAMIPHMVDDKYWKLLIKTVFRESESNPFYTGKNQVVIYF